MNSPLPPTSPRKSRKWLWLLLGGLATAACLLSMVCAAPFVLAAVRIAADRAPASALLTEYMQDMQAKDAQAARALFSPHMQADLPKEYLQVQVEDPSYGMYDNFQSLAIGTLVLKNETSDDPLSPRGETAHIHGTLVYSDGYTGTFVAILEKVEGKWMIYSVSVTVPQDKK